MSAIGDVHMGRSWTGHELEDSCPCPEAPCGLVHGENIDPVCPQHNLNAARTMRQMHYAKDCPAKVPYEPDEMGFGWEDAQVWLPRSRYSKQSDARKFYAEHTGVPYVEIRVLARWAVHDPRPYEPEWWVECPKGTPGAFPVWRCE